MPDTPDAALLQSSPCLQGERVAFTGTLASMTHRQASELVEQNGGEAASHISRQMTMLVVGEEGWPLEADGKASLKLQQAVESVRQGATLHILTEFEWLHLLGLEQRERDEHRLFTPAMLQQKLGISVGVVRRWERLGLIRAVQRVFRLPYFDFQEVAGVRRLQEMLSAGIPREQIESSLRGLQLLFPSMDRPLAQLDILSRDSTVMYRDARGLVEARGGQRRFDFDGSEASTDAPENVATVESGMLPPAARESGFQAGQAFWTSEDWFDRGCQLLEEDDRPGAIEAFRMAIMDCPDDPEIHFHLADALFRGGNLSGALERYHVAAELDHEYIEAWTQLGCLRSLLDDADGAINAFDIALSVHADFSEAIYHKATVLARTSGAESAVELWQRYLKLDPEGPWAESVREQLDSHRCHSPNA